MKRLATLLLAAGLVFGASQAAQAVEFKASGVFEAYFGWSNANNSQAFPHDPISDTSDRFRPSQRVRLQLEMIASENLRAVFQIENNILWGQSDPDRVGGGGAVGGDGYGVQVKHAYLDWIIPNADIHVRIGIQPIATPGLVAGSAILDDDIAGIVISKVFTENIAASIFWTRPLADNIPLKGSNPPTSGGHDAADLFGLIVPLTFDGFTIIPWLAYGQTGKNMGGWTRIGSSNNYENYLTNNPAIAGVPNIPDADAWYAAITAELVAFDPFRFAIDFNYGSIDTDAHAMGVAGAAVGDSLAMKTSGYVVSAIAEYKMDMMTPGLLMWYASGNDADAATKGGGAMPILSPSWTGTSFGFSDYFGSGNDSVELFGASPIGTWGGALQFKDISFMEDMTHLFRVAYYMGTNHRNAAGFDNAGNSNNPWSQSPTYMTEEDSAFEINFNTKYNIYENLAFILELAYIGTDWDNSINHPSWASNRRDDAYRVNASFGYSF